MSTNYGEDLIKRELKKAENLQGATRHGKVVTIFVGVLETCCRTGKTDEQNFILETSEQHWALRTLN